MMYCYSKRSAAFTLIEVMVVISIIGITSAIIINSLSTQRAMREVDRAAHTFGANLREAQNYALAGRSTSLTQENCYYGIRITSATAYNLVNYARSGGVCDTPSTITSLALPSGVQFSGIGTYPTVFAFLLPRAEVYTGTSGALGTLGAAQLIGFTKSGQTMYLCLYPSGRVEQRGVTASCP